MPGAVTYELGRGWVRTYRWIGVGFISFVAICLPMALVGVPQAWMLLLLCGAVLLGFGVWALWLGLRPRRFSIELSRDGVRVPAEGRWAPWSELADLRERPLLGRLDITDRSGGRFAALEYQLDGFNDAVRSVVEYLSPPVPEIDEFGARPSLLLPGAVVLGMCASFSLLVGLEVGLILGAIWCPLLLMIALDRRRVSLDEDGITLHRRRAHESIPWREVADVELSRAPAGVGDLRLGVYLVLRSGERREIRPPNANPIHLFARIQHWLSRPSLDVAMVTK